MDEEGASVVLGILLISQFLIIGGLVYIAFNIHQPTETLNVNQLDTNLKTIVSNQDALNENIKLINSNIDLINANLKITQDNILSSTNVSQVNIQNDILSMRNRMNTICGK